MTAVDPDLSSSPRQRARRFARMLAACANRTWTALLLFGAIVAVLGLLVALLEGWPAGDGLWWAFTTATTTGYGDLSPASGLGRLLAVATMFVGIIGIGVIVGRIAATVIETRDAWKHEEQEQVKADVAAAHAEAAHAAALTEAALRALYAIAGQIGGEKLRAQLRLPEERQTRYSDGDSFHAALRRTASLGVYPDGPPPGPPNPPRPPHDHPVG